MVWPNKARAANPRPPSQRTDWSAATNQPRPNGCSRSSSQTWMVATMFSNKMLAVQAIAAPVMPIRGISSRFSPTFRASESKVLSRFQELLPPIRSMVVTLPVPRFTSMAIERIASAVEPLTNSGPNTRSTTGPNANRLRYSGQHRPTSHQVPTWYRTCARGRACRASSAEICGAIAIRTASVANTPTCTSLLTAA